MFIFKAPISFLNDWQHKCLVLNRDLRGYEDAGSLCRVWQPSVFSRELDERYLVITRRPAASKGHSERGAKWRQFAKLL